MSVSWLVLELWQFLLIKDWPKIWKSEIPPPEFCPISGDWDELGIPNLARMFLIQCYYMLQNARVTAFTVSDLWRENQQGGSNYPLPRFGLKMKIAFKVKKTFAIIFKGLLVARSGLGPTKGPSRHLHQAKVTWNNNKLAKNVLFLS